MKCLVRTLGGAIIVASCASPQRFYSVRELAFVRVGAIRAELIGRWRSSSGRTLDLFDDGKFSREGMTGCWDVDDARIVFVWSCTNYGRQQGDPFLAIAEARDACNFTMAKRLTISGCLLAGEYRRDLAEEK